MNRTQYAIYVFDNQFMTTTEQQELRDITNRLGLARGVTYTYTRSYIKLTPEEHLLLTLSLPRRFKIGKYNVCSNTME